MKPRDKISKSSWMVLESIKDSVTANITTAVRTGQLKIEPQVVQTLLTIVSVSAEEAFHKSNKTFMKSVDAAISEVALGEEMPDLSAAKSAAKKK